MRAASAALFFCATADPAGRVEEEPDAVAERFERCEPCGRRETQRGFGAYREISAVSLLSPTDFNSIVKSVVRTIWPTLLRAMGVANPPSHAHFEDVTLTQIAEHRADQVLVYDPPDVPSRGAHYFEYAVAPPDRETLLGWIYKRCCLEKQLGCPVVLVAVYLWQGRRRTFPDRMFTEVLGATDDMGFTKLEIWKLRDRILSGELRELAPFLVLCGEDPPEQSLVSARELIIQGDLPAATKSLLIGATAAVALRRLPLELVMSVLSREVSMLKEIPLIQEWLREREEIGVAKGRDQGRLEAARMILIEVAEPRLGVPSPQIASRIAECADLQRLIRVTAEISQFETWDEIFPENGEPPSG